MKTKVDSEIGPLIHLGATSVDILDTALSCRMRDVTQNVVLPELKKLENYLCDIAERECATPQVGRTHGQHAVPITFGWSIAEFVSRLGKSILRIEELSNQLVGKLAGPVGSYNGPSMIVKKLQQIHSRGDKEFTADMIGNAYDCVDVFNIIVSEAKPWDNYSSSIGICH